MALFRAGALLLPTWLLLEPCAHANPHGGTVTAGKATITSQGPQLTINQGTGFASINWQSFNIMPGETTTFIQPSATSVIFNQISGLNPSILLGNLHANGLVVLENSAGFYIGGQASLSAHGLILSTGPVALPDVTGSSAWTFNAPPPTAKIINYGTLNIGGGPAYLIANDIENKGTITDNGGNIGLFAGKQVLISSSPDGRGLSAEVTLPQGSVDNTGKLIADGGTIAMRAQVVNQGGLVQANSIRQVNGAIELYASESLNLSSSSVVSAQGDSKGVSDGGTVTLKSDGAYTDQIGSTINISGGAQGGNGGHAEISAATIGSIKSTITGHAAKGYTSGSLFIDPDNILLTDYGDTLPANGTVDTGYPNSSASPDTLTLDVGQINNLIQNNNLSQISLAAKYNIEIATLWQLPDSTVPNSLLSLSAGRNITIDNSSDPSIPQYGIQAGRNWSINMIAGTELTSAANKQSGMDGIYVMGNSIIQTINGDITLKAGNEVIVDNGSSGSTVDGNGITTTGGGNINVTATYGDVNTGGSPEGYLFGLVKAPYYRVSPQLGGISTANGGNVTIIAGGNVTSYLPLQNGPNNPDITEAGAGAYGAAPGNVTITAGGNVYGHYVVANGAGIITVQNGDVGASSSDPSQGFALSLIKGGWTVNAPNGNIYLQDIRNPNGTFNDRGNATSYGGYHLFDYGADASLTLNAGNLVEITGALAPRNDPLPLIFPPQLDITSGSGGVVFDTSVITWASPAANLSINTAGNLVGNPGFSGQYPTLSMSDSASKQWIDSDSFGPSDRSSTAPAFTDNTPVGIKVSGSMDTLNLVTTKETHIKIDGDMINSSFIGENLQSSDKTSICVGGQIFEPTAYSFANLSQALSLPSTPLIQTWQDIFGLLVDPSVVNKTIVSANDSASDLKSLATSTSMLLFPVTGGQTANPGFVYNSTTLQLGFKGVMDSTTLGKLTGTLEMIAIGANGLPEVDSSGHFVTVPVNFASASVIEQLYTESQSVTQNALPGLQIGGPGTFYVKAGSISLGASEGIESWGYGGNFGSLYSITPVGASIDVHTGNLDMVSSRIASFDGGSVSVTSTGQMDLGSPVLFGTSSDSAFGIYSATAGGAVNVTAQGDINIEGSRIASYGGSDITIESLAGNVNIGGGGAYFVNVPQLIGQTVVERPVFGSGVVSLSLPGTSTTPGDVTITAKQGNITAQSAGILQLSLGSSTSQTPLVTLDAGTAANGNNPAITGNIDLGTTGSGIISINSKLTATGYIKGLVFAKNNASISATHNVDVNLLAQSASVNSQSGSVTGNLVATDLSASGGSGVQATVLSQSASVNGSQSTSTLGTSAPALASSQSAVQQANAQSKQTVGNETLTPSTDDDSSKKKRIASVLQRIKRVTVLLPGQ